MPAYQINFSKNGKADAYSIALLDVAYLRLLIQAGSLILLFVALLYMCGMKKEAKQSNQSILLIMFIHVLFGLFESGFNNVYLNFTLLFVAQSIYSLECSVVGTMEECI